MEEGRIHGFMQSPLPLCLCVCVGFPEHPSLGKKDQVVLLQKKRKKKKDEKDDPQAHRSGKVHFSWKDCLLSSKLGEPFR